MDEAQIIDWYDIVEAVANGRLTGHRCPICEAETLNATLEHGRVRVACPGCGEGFEGRLSGGRDDGFYAEAGAMMSRRAAPAPAPVLVEAEGLAAMRAELEAARATLERHWPREPFPLEWIPASAGFELPLGKGRLIRAFTADHASADVALGYLVVERRRRLK
ncbi:hypothetical protein KKB55_17680, partial [Myxococcota bacterium]|nr:hypothetical protein [Myxococcota bacterium]